MLYALFTFCIFILQIIGVVLLGAVFVALGVVIAIVINYFTDVMVSIVDYLLDLFD